MGEEMLPAPVRGVRGVRGGGVSECRMILLWLARYLHRSIACYRACVVLYSMLCALLGKYIDETDSLTRGQIAFCVLPSQAAVCKLLRKNCKARASQVGQHVQTRRFMTSQFLRQEAVVST